MQKNKKLTIIIAAIVVVILAIAAFLIASRLGSSNKLSENLDLGNQYLTEQNYEEAVAAFLVAIDIDPKCAEAYIGAANAYIGLGDYDSALAILEQGLDATDGDESISEKIEEVQEEIDTQSGADATESADTQSGTGEKEELYIEYDWNVRKFNLYGATLLEDGTDAVAAQFGLSFENMEKTDTGWYAYNWDGPDVSIYKSETSEGGIGKLVGTTEVSYYVATDADGISFSRFEIDLDVLYSDEEDFLPIDGLYWQGMTYDDVNELLHIDEIVAYYPEVTNGSYSFESNMTESYMTNSMLWYTGDQNWCYIQFNDYTQDFGYARIEYSWDESGKVTRIFMTMEF